MKHFSHILLLAVSLGGFAMPASAGIYTDWDTNSKSTTTTTNNDLAGHSWRNILKFWFAYDATNAYFRMDLAGGPGTDFPNVLESVLYAVYVNADGNGANDTGANGTESIYLYYDGAAVNGIDYIMDIHYSNTGGLSQNDVHAYNGTGPVYFDRQTYADNGAQYDVGPYSIEWSILRTNFGLGASIDEAVVYGAVYDITSPTSSYDLARIDVTNVPLLPTWIFLAPSVLGLVALRRFRRV